MPSLSYKERIVDFFSQKININKQSLNIYDIEEEYYNLLSDILNDPELSIKKRQIYFSVLYRLIFYTRDAVYGLNNYEAAFIMIGSLIQYGFNNKNLELQMNILAYNAIASFIQINEFHTAYGNWNDIKYFCNYLKNVIAANNINDVTEYQTFKDIIDLYVLQLVNEEKYQGIISTVTQYMPREKSKLFGWVAYYISTAYYQTWMKTATTNESYIRAVRKCLTHYRALLANPNKLPLYSFIKGHNKEDNNKIIDSWIKLLFEVSNERYEWATEFGQTVLEESFIRKSHEILSKEIEASSHEAHMDEEHMDEAHMDEEHMDEEHMDEEQKDEVDVDEVDVDEEHMDEEHVDEEHVDEEHVGEEHVDEEQKDPLFDKTSIMNEEKDSAKKNHAYDKKKSGWFGWLGWN
jgi:hypothetical protein